MRILIAGIGNIFEGDDAFGVETIRKLSELPVPQGVRVVDFGIRSYDLAYAIMDGYDVVIMVDAAPRGEVPGTIYLMELELDSASEISAEDVNAHTMNPLGVLQMVRSLGGNFEGKIYLVGCEPAVLESEDGVMGLSPAVQAAVPCAVELIQQVLQDFVNGRPPSDNLRSEEVPCVTQENS